MFWWFGVLQQVVYSFALLEYRGNWEQNSIQLVVGGGGGLIYIFMTKIYLVTKTLIHEVIISCKGRATVIRSCWYVPAAASWRDLLAKNSLLTTKEIHIYCRRRQIVVVIKDRVVKRFFYHSLINTFISYCDLIVPICAYCSILTWV